MKVENVEVKEREYTSADFLRLNEETRDPNLHYRWVRLDDTNSSVLKHSLKGYTPVAKSDIETVSTPLDKGGDHVVVGDLMLMACPKDKYEARQAEVRNQTEMKLQSTTIEAERRAAEKGIKLITDKDHKKETR